MQFPVLMVFFGIWITPKRELSQLGEAGGWEGSGHGDGSPLQGTGGLNKSLLWLERQTGWSCSPD